MTVRGDTGSMPGERRRGKALAGLGVESRHCLVQVYPCERWSQVSSLYWSCLMSSLAS
jgi:hypothetical protein